MVEISFVKDIPVGGGQIKGLLMMLYDFEVEKVVLCKVSFCVL